MSKLVWGQIGEKTYEAGVEQVALFLLDESNAYSKGVAWNGVTGVTESPSGAEPNDFYADNVKYASIRSAEDFGATITAYDYPDEFNACNGYAELAEGVVVGQQSRKAFGLAYKTKLGNDVDGQDHGYKLHLVYGATASPSEKAYTTINDSPEIIEFSWELTTTPVSVPGMKPSASITLDSTVLSAEKMKKVEDAIYGTDSEEAHLPLPAELVTLLA